ncbi:MAG: DsbA family protein [Burkholderiales bacterium]|nr:DsbA family protein [Burkholderiales bacterium]
MNALRLHYTHDPLCGWCYAASPLVDAATRAGIALVLHGGSLWEDKTRLSQEKRQYILQHDARIAELAGVAFGTAYRDRMRNDTDVVFSSRPTLTAILAAGTLRSGADLAMLHAIQTAHYVHGQDVAAESVLLKLAQELDLDIDAFVDALNAAQVDQHFRESRDWMARFGQRGFPGFVLQDGDRYLPVQHGSFYGNPDAFLHALRALASPVEA